MYSDCMKNQPTNLLTLRSKVFLEVDCYSPDQYKRPSFYWTGGFITVFTRTCHWTLSWVSWVQITSLHLISNVYFNTEFQSTARFDQEVSSLDVFLPKFCTCFSFSPCLTLHNYPWFYHYNNIKRCTETAFKYRHTYYSCTSLWIYNTTNFLLQKARTAW